MIKKLLIANRGEIACRIIQTAKRLGIETVAVYSDADSFSPHRYLACQAVNIGPSRASDSYLNINKLLAIAKANSVDAIHPGYGFLSENAAFAQACNDAGILFVGPSAKSIKTMAYKDKAKDIMAAAGIPVVPGFHQPKANFSQLKEAATEIGFPLLIKASAGGGGKGMRVVESDAELEESLNRARSEALKFFGSDEVILEKFLSTPRHIEVQIFADKAGNVLHLFERDCSIQRRYQKVLEEAPALDLSQKLKARLYQAAIDAAKAVHYEGAGTLEFLVEGDDFYFMEMNTRLQVEHPVTEAITGLDLVEWQLLVASGETLPLKQSDIRKTGYAIEARLYAEDPSNDFLPSTGLIEALKFPAGANVRIDTGFEAGNRISLFYDPMLAKIICHASSREEALTCLNHQLANTLITGIHTNIPYLIAVVTELAATNESPNTKWLSKSSQKIQNLQKTNAAKADILALVALIETMLTKGSDPWIALRHWRQNKAPEKNQECWLNGVKTDYHFIETHDGFSLYYKKRKYEVSHLSLSHEALTLKIDGTDHSALVHLRGSSLVVQYLGTLVRIDTSSLSEANQSDDSDNALKAPMTAQVIQIHCQAGDKVRKGETIMILEAMKMEHSIKSPHDGVIESILYQAQDLVEEGMQLVNLVKP